MKVADLVGKQVITSEAEVLGQIEGVDVDISTWTVSNLLVTLLKSNVKKLNFKKPFLNGMYAYLFILQLGSVIPHSIQLFQNPIIESYLDIFYWLNHIPHLIGFYLLVKKEIDININKRNKLKKIREKVSGVIWK